MELLHHIILHVIYMYAACHYHVYTKMSIASVQYPDFHSHWPTETITFFSQNQLWYMLPYLNIFPEKFSLCENIH